MVRPDRLHLRHVGIHHLDALPCRVYRTSIIVNTAGPSSYSCCSMEVCFISFVIRHSGHTIFVTIMPSASEIEHGCQLD